MIIIILWTALLFTTIGVAASDFFCINLSTISSLLGLSESMAGVTFLAFGNGSPDVFSTFAAVKSHSGSLAIGELIGAAGFITAVVSGTMAIIRPFHVYKRSFVRDVGFFIASVAFSMVFLANGALALWECAVMVAFYVFYVIVVVVWHWYLTRRRRKRERDAAVRGHYTITDTDEVEAEEEYHDEDTGSSRRGSSRPISIRDFDALERASYLEGEDYDILDDEETRDKWMGELSSNMRITKPPDRHRNTIYTPIRPSLVGALEFQAVLSSLRKSRTQITSPTISMRRYSDAPYYTSAQQQDQSSTTEDPAGAHNAYEAALEAQDESEGYFSAVNRGRAHSTNDASALRRSQDERRAPAPDIDLLGEPAVSEEPREIYGTFGSEGGSQSGARSPRVSITSPPPEVDYIPPARERANTADLLAPPDLHIYPHRRTQSYDSQDRSRPQPPKLKIPGVRNRTSPKMSPMHSPLIQALQRSDSSGLRSLLLPRSESTPTSAEDPATSKTKPVAWWPHSILPPPSLLLRALFPTLDGWRSKSLWEKTLGICAAPSFFFLTVTLPVVEPEEEDKEQEKQLPTGPARSDSAIKDFESNTKTGPQRQPSTHPHLSTASAAVHTEETHHHNDHARPPLDETEPPPPPADHTSVAISTGKDWNRWLVLVQTITAPFFIVLVIWANFSLEPRALLRPALYTLLGSLVILLLLLVTTTPSRPPRWHFLLTFVGFAVSIAWISTIANEVVGVLKTIGVIFNMSDAILGLTIFAVGNSLGDLVADITVARLGYPVMALSACFGGPMLNILLGIGLSGLYMSIAKAEKRQHKHPGRPINFKPYHVQVSTTLLISAVVLLITLVGLLIVVPLNGWKMDRRIGIGLIVLWVIGTIGNVVVEVTGIGDELTDELLRTALKWRR